VNYLKILEELRSEADMVDHAIAVMERLQLGAPRRRGRPPRWLTERKKELGNGGASDHAAAASSSNPESKGAAGADGAPVKRGRGRPRKNPIAS